MKYLRVYKILAIHNFSTLVASRLDFWTLILGKLIRMGFMFVWILAIFNFIENLAGYSKAQTLMFFATFNLVDILAQVFFFRGFWFIQQWVKDGEFDRILTYPLSPIFTTAFKITDWMDVVTLIPSFGLLIYALRLLGSPLGLANLLLYMFLIINGLLIAFAINLFIASITFYTTETRNIFWLYRDLMYTGRFPPEIFNNIIRLFFTFVMPVVVIIAFPTRVLLGLLSLKGILYAVSFSLVVTSLSFLFWKNSLNRYSSVSS